MPGAVEKAIIDGVGSLDKFKEDFVQAGVSQFGSGWAWLAVKNGKVEIMKTPNGENPLVQGAKPILGVDVWEHSYYIDYRNRRPDYLKAFLDHLVNWEHVEKMLGEAR
jgi:Fe-Mn family superoxide dismutase